MRGHSLVSLVSTCNATAYAECVTNGVVRFLVCCATFALSVVSFFHAELFFFFGPCLFERLVTSFSFELSLRKFKFESTSFLYFYDFLNPFLGCFETSSGIVVGIRTGVWVSGCAGVWVCW